MRLLVAQGVSSIIGDVRIFGEVAVLEYGIGPMSGVLILDSLDDDVTVKVIEGCGHLASDEGEGTVVHCQACCCEWCQAISRVLSDQ